MQRRIAIAAALLGAALIGGVLASWGQPLVSRSGTFQLFVGAIWSAENSQQIADWYSLSHAVHGMLVVLAGRLFLPNAGFPVLFGVAIVTGVAWEIVEHTDWVLETFRGTTIYIGYRGDTVLNAVSDYGWMLGGFFLANALRTRWVVVLILCVELASALIARDSLTLTTLGILYPVGAIEAWQQGLRPPGIPER